ncbi:MAG TPA: chemotaxis protein CheW [Mariprofundaceae bacterium]|nr:chemotaxis protein CheW [Mariprofundaceae bacterium]
MAEETRSANENAAVATPEEIKGDIAQELAARLEDVLLTDIGGKELLVRVAETREVIRPLPLTPVPMGPDHLLGLANVRGQIVCVIDPGKISSLPDVNREITPQTRFVVLRHPRMHVGIWVDAVRAIYQVRSDDLPQPAARESGAARTKDYSSGTLEVGGRSYEVLDCSVIFH